MQFNQLLHSIVKDPNQRFVGRLLALDPGETTGWAVFDCTEVTTKLIRYGQLLCTPIDQGLTKMQSLVMEEKCTRAVYEDYKVYSWKSAAHSWASLHTPQLIGATRLILNQQGVPFTKQMAQEAKGFVTDDKLQEWGYYIKGKKHTRDALRHAFFYLLFRHSKQAK